VKRLGRKHGAKHRQGQIKRMVADPLQIARVTFLKCQSSEPRLCSSLVSGVNEVFGNVDSNHDSPQPGERDRRGAIAAAKVQHPKRWLYSERLYECFSRLTHQGGDLGKVPFLPQR